MELIGMNNLKVFNNELFGDIKVLTINEEVLFELYSTGMALGHIKYAKGKAYPRKDRINKTVEDAEISTVVHNGQQYLTEEQLYDFMLECKTDNCKPFKKWITHEVLPEIRKTGCYITESCTDEAIDFNRVYGKRRIRKSIRESKDLRKLFEDYIELSAIERVAGRLTNKDRINTLDIMADELECKMANEAINMRGSELLAIRELLTDIANEKTRLSNKYNGGIKGGMTRRITALEAENKELRDMVSFEPDWKLISQHGFSNNYHLEYDPLLKRMVRTKAYKIWLKNFDYSDFRELNCDINRPMAIYLHFGKLEKFDVQNLQKSVIDVIAEYYGFNDNLIVETYTTCDTVNSYEEGYIYFDLINID